MTHDGDATKQKLADLVGATMCPYTHQWWTACAGEQVLLDDISQHIVAEVRRDMLQACDGARPVSQGSAIYT